MAPLNIDGLSPLLMGVRLLFVILVSMCLMVQIKGLNSDYKYPHNANDIIKTSHIQPLGGEESTNVNKEDIPLTDLSQFHRTGGETPPFDGFALNEISQPPPSSNAPDSSPRQEKITRFEKHSNLNISIEGNNNNGPNMELPIEGVCHMDIEYRLTKRILGRCTNLGHSVRGCIAGNYLQIYHPKCY